MGSPKATAGKQQDRDSITCLALYPHSSHAVPQSSPSPQGSLTGEKNQSFRFEESPSRTVMGKKSSELESHETRQFISRLRTRTKIASLFLRGQK